MFASFKKIAYVVTHSSIHSGNSYTRLTSIFCAITSGSSHTDSTKNTCKDTTAESVWRLTGTTRIQSWSTISTLKPFCSANLTIVPLLSLVVFVASKTWKSRKTSSLSAPELWLLRWAAGDSPPPDPPLHWGTGGRRSALPWRTGWKNKRIQNQHLHPSVLRGSCSCINLQ